MLFIIKTCMSNDMLVLALSCHMTYIFKKCPSKNLKTNLSNSGPVHVYGFAVRYNILMFCVKHFICSPCHDTLVLQKGL